MNTPHHRLDRRRLLSHLAGGLLGSAGSGLLVAAGPARACEFSVPTLRVTHPWAMASGAQATEAGVFMRIDEVNADDALVAVHTPLAAGARVIGPHGSPSGTLGALAAAPRPLPLPLAAGQPLSLEPEGLHLQLTGLNQPLLLGRAYPMTLVFARGGEMLAQLSIDFPGPRFG